MAGSIVSDPGNVPLARPSVYITVERFNADAGDPDQRYELLPNVRCVQIDAPREGGDPGSARFRYAFGDPAGDPDDPQRVEQVTGYDASGLRVVRQDDRLVVRAHREDGYSEMLFDGWVLAPQADLAAPDTESASFTAVGLPARESDTPLGGAVYRNADVPASAGEDNETGLPARFNPDGKPNASPDSADTVVDGIEYPVFLGPVWPKNQINGQTIRHWTLGMAARYVIAQGNPDQEWVTYDDLSYLDSLLKAPKPSGGGDKGPIDLGVVEFEDIECQDLEVTGTAWPEALARLIEPHGLTFRFVLSEDLDGDPKWTFVVYRKDDDRRVKALPLQPPGEPLDPAASNVGALGLARDTHDLFNRVVIDAAPVQYEASFVLAPGFQISGGDVSNQAAFTTTNLDPTSANREKYRLFLMDECGEGHWDMGEGSWVAGDPGDLGLVLNPDRDDVRPFVIRRRKGLSPILTKDTAGKALPAALHVSTDYTGSAPGVWNGSGTWQVVASGEWHMTEDRLGVFVSARDPNSWHIGTSTDPTAPFPNGLVTLVEALNAANGKQKVYLRLTCCVDADTDFGVDAPARTASPTEFTITRRVDARDRFRKTVVSRLSCYNSGNDDVTVTDDTDDARAHADGVRRANEAGKFAGSVTIPRLSTAYAVGDKVSGVEGRTIDFRANAAGESGESPVYPSVVGLTWHLDGRQETVLTLDDRRAEPPPKRGRGYAES
jgi:hypothetical protein